MLAAAATHTRRGERQLVAVNGVPFALAAFVARQRFGPNACPRTVRDSGHGGPAPTMDPMATPTKRVLLAAPRGYCAGVDRAVVTVEKALELYGAPVYVRKQIVHNVHVVTTLEKRGAIFVDETDEVPEGATVVLSAHGVAPVVHEEARARSLRSIDATCPLVTKVHREAVRFADADYDILLIGHEGHEEVVGTSGEAPEHIQLVDGPDDVANVTVRDPDKVVWLSQTTLSVDETMETVRRLRERFPSLQDPPSDDICYATQNRQLAVKQMAADCDLMIVVGSRNSSNSVRLVEVALEHGSRAGHLVDYAADVDEAWLDGISTVGVTSGASVPEILVREVLELLAQHGFEDVTPVVAAEESLMFALPTEIRRDLKAAGMSDKMRHDASFAGAGSGLH
jgi:4-hydroxy-3-methylbut-2-enyl diphosphate reductase